MQPQQYASYPSSHTNVQSEMPNYMNTPSYQIARQLSQQKTQYKADKKASKIEKKTVKKLYKYEKKEAKYQQKGDYRKQKLARQQAMVQQAYPLNSAFSDQTSVNSLPSVHGQNMPSSFTARPSTNSNTTCGSTMQPRYTTHADTHYTFAPC
jgi:hypothetical protein